ncbi:MAG: hypothetical protein WCO44_12425 [Bacteroidota bacterium]
MAPKPTKAADSAVKDEPVEHKTDASSNSKKVHKFHEKAKEVFATHNVDQVHFTDDGTAFIHPQHARMHAENLKDNVIHIVNREEV